MNKFAFMTLGLVLLLSACSDNSSSSKSSKVSTGSDFSEDLVTADLSVDHLRVAKGLDLVTVSWQGLEGAADYQVIVQEGGSEVANEFTNGATSVNLAISSSSTLYYTVKAFDVSGQFIAESGTVKVLGFDSESPQISDSGQ